MELMNVYVLLVVTCDFFRILLLFQVIKKLPVLVEPDFPKLSWGSPANVLMNFSSFTCIRIDISQHFTVSLGSHICRTVCYTEQPK
jgi:hypothetical protein